MERFFLWMAWMWDMFIAGGGEEGREREGALAVPSLPSNCLSQLERSTLYKRPLSSIFLSSQTTNMNIEEMNALRLSAESTV
jgi:hypothetical protein